MTAVYAIAALVIIAGIMLGAYLVGFGDGIEAEKMRRTCYIVQKDFSHDDVEETPPGGEAQADPCGYGPDGGRGQKQGIHGGGK